MTPDAYHQLPGLSSSGARKLLDCPAKFKYELDNPPPPKDVFDFGRVAHRLVLGEGDQYQVVYADSWRSQSARDLRDQARADGRTPILAKDFDTAQAMATALHKSHAADLFTDGKPAPNQVITQPAQQASFNSNAS